MAQAIKPITKYSYRVYECYPNDGFRHEIVDGEHYMSAAPATKHQKVSRKLHFQLYAQIELTKNGEVYCAPTDVELSDHDIVQPDIVIVLSEQLAIITPQKIHGVPALVIEILSPSNRRYDQILKLEMYQRTGVPEYWIVDTEAETVHQFVLVAGRYSEVGIFSDKISGATIAGVEVNLIEAWS